MAQAKKVLKFRGEIKELELSQIIPYEFNNKIHKDRKINLLANIMGKFGYIDEIVVDRNNILIAGHGRLESIKKMGYDAVEVKVLDLDSKNASELRLLHNKISEFDTEEDLANIKLEIDTLGYNDTMEGLDISLKELYPEYEAPAFEDEDEEEEQAKKIAVTVWFDELANAELCKQDLEGLGYAPVIKG